MTSVIVLGNQAKAKVLVVCRRLGKEVEGVDFEYLDQMVRQISDEMRKKSDWKDIRQRGLNCNTYSSVKE